MTTISALKLANITLFLFQPRFNVIHLPARYALLLIPD